MNFKTILKVKSFIRDFCVGENLPSKKRNGGNSPTPTFAEINAAPNAKFINSTRKISLVFKSFYHKIKFTPGILI